MKNDKERLLKNFLDNIKSRRLVFWGVGKIFHTLRNEFDFSKVETIGFYDAKVATVTDGLKPLPFDIIKEKKDDIFVVISCGASSEIKEILDDLGYLDKCDYIDGSDLFNSLLEWEYEKKGIPFAKTMKNCELDRLADCISEEIPLVERHLSSDTLRSFEQKIGFDNFYHLNNDLSRKRKIAEYLFADTLLELSNFEGTSRVYLDVGCSSSPWVWYLREKRNICAFGIDRERDPLGRDYYLEADAVHLPFDNSSVMGISMQSSFCLFEGTKDIELIREYGRVLCAGGKVVIAPLYMYDHFVSGVSAKWYGKGFSDSGSEELIRTDCGGELRMSRFYDVKSLGDRVLSTCDEVGLSWSIITIPTEEVPKHKFPYLKFVLYLQKKED